MPPRQDDDDLVARLKALRNTGDADLPGNAVPAASSLSTSGRPDDLANRFRLLSRHGVNDDLSSFGTAPLDPESEPSAGKSDLADDLVDFGQLKAFLAEAKNTLDTSIPDLPDEFQSPDAETTDSRIETSSKVDPEDPEVKTTEENDSGAEDDELADEYIERVLAELEFDMKTKLASNDESGDLKEPSSEPPPDKSTEFTADSTQPEEWTEADTLELPSAPLELVDVPAGDVSPFPSVPSLKPSKKNAQSKNIFLQPDSDGDTETWCVICYDDATVTCNGCDGDLYCARCWKQGHMGESADPEERMHKWTTYKAPRKIQ